MFDISPAALDVFSVFTAVLFVVGNVFALMKFGEGVSQRLALAISTAFPLMLAVSKFQLNFVEGAVGPFGYLQVLVAITLMWLVTGGALIGLPAILGAVNKGLDLLIRAQERASEDDGGRVVETERGTGAGDPTTISDVESGDESRERTHVAEESESASSSVLSGLSGVLAGLRRRLTTRHRLPAVEHTDE